AAAKRTEPLRSGGEAARSAVVVRVGHNGLARLEQTVILLRNLTFAVALAALEVAVGAGLPGVEVGRRWIPPDLRHVVRVRPDGRREATTYRPHGFVVEPHSH